MKKINLAKILVIIIIGGLLFIGLDLWYFHSHFSFGATVNEVKVGGLSAKAAAKKVNENYRSKSILLTAAGKRERLPLTEVYQIDQQLMEQKIRQSKSQLPLQRNFKTKLQQHLIAFENEKQIEAQDAAIVAKKNKFKVIPEVNSNMIDQPKVIAKIHQDAVNGRLKKSYSLVEFYQQPKQTQEKLRPVAKRLNTLLKQKIKIHFGDQRITMKKQDLLTLFNERGQADPQKIADWLSTFNDQYATIYKPVDFSNIHGQHLQYENVGNYGYSVDFIKAPDNLANKLNQKKVAKTLEIQIKGDPKLQPRHVRKNYIEVDLDHQKMYCFKNGKKVVSTAVITGQDSKNLATPPGFHTVMDKQRNTALSGAIVGGEGSYSVPVNYWLPLLSYGQTITGVGLHDLVAKEKIYGDSKAYATGYGSYGCINTPLAAVKKIYQEAYIGMPVFIYGQLYENSPGEFDKPVGYGMPLED